VRAAPAVSCANMCKETHTSIQVQRRQSGLPCAMVLRLIPRSPRRRIRLVTVANGLRLCETRSGPQILHWLDTSNGCQDHAALPSAIAPLVCARASAHGQNPPCECTSRDGAIAATASCSNVRDDGRRPSCGTGRQPNATDLGSASSEFLKIRNRR
jgi:hypothetical protein